jgi:spermidine synthase
MSAESPFLPALLLLFVGSGAAALIYQIVWFQMLSLIIGSSAISLGLLLATFMGGMCIGSLALPYVIPADRHPLRVYAMIEAGIGVFGLLVLLLLPLVGSVYAALGGAGFFGLVLRAVLSVIILLPPTVLMGATLPAIARWVEATPKGVSWLGFFYAGNIGGAVFGTLFAGFYLLRVHDVTISTVVAVAMNAAVALIGFVLSRVTAHHPAPAARSAASAGPRVPPGSWPVFVTIGLSGLTALGSEVLWTRLLGLAFGATVYTFSLILAAVLLGLGVGSSIGSFAARNSPNPRAALGACQFLLMGALAWAAYAMTQALPYWPINPNLSASPWFTFQIDFARALWTVLPGAVLWGASFPLALAAVASGREDPGHVVGGVYAANTVGAIVGSLAAALLVIGWMGTQQGQRLLIVLAGVSALLMLGLVFTEETGRLRVQGRSALWGVITVGAALWLASTVQPVPGLLVAYGRYAATWVGSEGEYVFVGEGTHSSMAVTRTWNGVLNYHNAGKVQASSEPQDMRLQRLLGHMTTLVPENPRSVLVIGFGAGVTAGAVSIDPRVEKVTIAEIERLVPEVVSTYFSEHNYGVATNPKVDVRIDDARHYLLTTDEKFDAITSDPFDPWVKGAATLYTREFFEVMRERLNPGGVVTVFVQLYQAGLDAVKSEIATFAEVFPNATVWLNTHEGTGYDLVLLGQVEPTVIDLNRWDDLLSRPDMAPVAYSLSEIGIYSADDLVSSYGGRAPELAPWLADAEINGDRNLRLQYLAGMNLNRSEQDIIHQQMLQYRTFPQDLFRADPQRLEALKGAMGIQ